MASSQPCITLRKHNVRVSYKNTCGYPAPRTSLQGHSNTLIALSTKVKTGSKPVQTGTLLYTVTGTLLYTVTGDSVRGRSTSSDVSSDISPSPLYIPPHRRQPKTECTRGSDTGVR